MTADQVVARLRKYKDRLSVEAADEIERLRAALEAVKELDDQYDDGESYGCLSGPVRQLVRDALK